MNFRGIRACGGIGIRVRLKIVWEQSRVGSIPTMPIEKTQKYFLAKNQIKIPETIPITAPAKISDGQ